MKRTLLTAATTSMIALAAPALASATHHSRSACHHRTHRACEHVHRARHARIVVFGAAPATGTTTGAPSNGPTTSTPTSSGDTAGTVASFTGGVLTITLTDGSTVSGKVTEETEIRCTTALAEGLGEGHDGEGGEDVGEDSHGGSGTSAHAADNSQGGSDDGGDGQHGESSSCTSAVLTPGAVVREAELSVSGEGAVWDHVDVIQ
ncbi:MAG: hypothetical protein ACYDHN_00265 [Solirubrobacteraceae bacterium]